MKIKRLIVLLALPIAGYIFIFCCNPSIDGSVINTLRPQETANWCWAAVTQMLAQHVGITVNQCDLANYVFSHSDCCFPQNPGISCPKSDSCNRPAWPVLDYAGLNFSQDYTALNWADIRKQIYCKEKPMGYAYGTSGVVGHVVVIKGYVSLGGIDYVVLNDPWPPCNGSERLITYNQYVDPAGTATHWRTFYNIAKK